ncbi:remorin 1.4 [Jatropha curcas]|uniref:remorin 1.4 n=1 Tax=Jatropha curcas TaxID=180498 RepID=UPI00189520EE|nr:remorin 1.4 [Jatropha curcas]
MAEEKPKTAESKDVSVPILAEEQKEMVEEREIVAQKPNDKENELAKIEWDKRYALIKAWEETEKAKVENKTYKKLSALGSWETNQKAVLESQIRQHEEKLERKKVEFAEKMTNKIAEIQKEAEERKTMIEAKRGQDFLKVEENAARYHSLGYLPRRSLICFAT